MEQDRSIIYRASVEVQNVPASQTIRLMVLRLSQIVRTTPRDFVEHSQITIHLELETLDSKVPLLGNGTVLPQSTQSPSVVGSTAVVSGYTFTSPSIYLQVLGAVTVSDICGQVGPTRTNVIIPIPSGGLSTVSYPVPIGSEYTDPNNRGGGGLGSSFGVTQAINTANFACPTWGLGIPFPETTTFAGGITQTNYHTLITTPYNPILIPPSQLQYLDPAWAAQCTAFYSFGEHIFSYGLYDPPYALTPNGGGLDPSPAPLPTPAPIVSTTAVDPIMTTPATPVPGSPSVFAPKTVASSSNMLQPTPSVSQSPSADPPAIPPPSATAVSAPQDPGFPPNPTIQQTASAPQDPGLPQTASSPQDPNPPQNPSSPQDPGLSQNPSSPQTSNTAAGGSNSLSPSGLGGIIYSAFGGPGSGIASTIVIPNSNPGTVAVDGQPVTIINPSVIAVNGATYTAGGAAATVSGEVISFASAGGAGQTLSVNPGALTIGGITLTPGGPGVMVSGTPISLAPSGVVVVGSSRLTIITPVPSIVAPSPSVITAGGQTITAAGTSALVFDHTTIIAGGPGVTISGTPFSLAPSGTLVVGTSKVALPSGQGNATINPFKGVAGRVDVERWWIPGGIGLGVVVLVWGFHW
ncbi:hypothetical protein MMC17_000142 [Xylographa soralifera]|nr:hypothetical protein [Xylographa soralifera]